MSKNIYIYIYMYKRENTKKAIKFAAYDARQHAAYRKNRLSHPSRVHANGRCIV